MSREATDFLYPFIEADERDPDTLLADLARSADEKLAESLRLREETLTRSGEQIERVATAMAERFAAGGRLFTFGNGGSSTDARSTAELFLRPPWGLPVAARSLAADEAVLTALANDIGFDVVFSRQLIAYARPVDIALGISTSGSSENLLVAFAEARKRGLLTVGVSGYEGGRMAASDDVQECIVARSQSVHRIQEAQAAVVHSLWAAVQARLSREDLT